MNGVGKLIIAGSRTWSPGIQTIVDALWYKYGVRYDEVEEIVCGMAPGADRAGFDFGEVMGIRIKQMPADWERLGKRAGKVRNRAMAEYADCALIFWDGDSSGSTNMHAWMSVLDKPSYVILKEGK